MKDALLHCGIKFEETTYKESKPFPELKGFLITDRYIVDKNLEHLFYQDGSHYKISGDFNQGVVYLPLNI